MDTPIKTPRAGAGRLKALFPWSKPTRSTWPIAERRSVVTGFGLLWLAIAMAVMPSFGFAQDEKSFYQRSTRSAERIRAAERSGKDVDSVAEGLIDVFYEYSRSRDLDDANAAMEAVESALREVFSEKEAAEYQERLKNRMPEVKAHLLGQCHIDLAWRWPWPETVEITQNTFWKQIAALEAAPYYRFHQNQAVLYHAIQEQDPTLFREIQKKVKAGSWRIVGGQWSETSQEQCLSESLVRNYLYGQRYFQEKFGHPARIGWQMEGSGYLSSFPQVMKSCGLEAAIFGRQKSWGGFWLPLTRWKGQDGSEIPIAMIYHYFAFQAESVSKVLTGLLEAAPSVNAAGYLFPFGGGDHGGGASLHLARKLAKQFRAAGLAAPTLDTDPTEYFRDIGTPESFVPTISGHLQLAPYGQSDCGLITQQRVKKGVRECETRLYGAEYLTTMLHALDPEAGGVNLQAPWKQLLVNQFHDIIWGTTSFDAYHESLVRFDLIRASASGTAQASLREFARRIDTEGEGVPIIAFNPLPWSRTGPVEVGLPKDSLFEGEEQTWSLFDPEGRQQVVQRIGERKALFVATDVPAGGYRVYWLKRGEPPAPELRVEVRKTCLLENKHLRLTINETGGISSLVLKSEGKEFVPNGKPANVPLIFRDSGSAWSSRLTERLWTEAPEPKIEIAESGPVRAGIRIEIEWPGGARTAQTVLMYHDLPIVECRIEGFWNEQAAQLAVDFPVDFQGSAFTEIPFGYLDWREHRDAVAETSALQRAGLKFEGVLDTGHAAPQNRWAAIEDGDWTLGLLNDAKPAVRIRHDGLQLPILRTPPFVARGNNVKNPKPKPGEPGFGAPSHNDIGEFEARYALVVGKASWRKMDLPRRGAAFNQPLIGVVAEAAAGPLPSESKLLQIRPESLMISCLKMAEDGSGESILRVYEAQGRPAEAFIALPRAAEVWETDMLENNGTRPVGQGCELRLAFRPHEIKTLRIRFQP